MRVAGRSPSRKPLVQPPPPVRGRVHIRIERCKGCDFCIEFCPQDVLAFSREFNPKGYHYPVVVKDECINCSLCLSLCPEYAIFSTPIGAVKGPDGPPDLRKPSQGTMP